MKNTMLCRTKNLSTIVDCYFFDKGEYIFQRKNPVKFPTVSVKYKELLDELAIPYRVVHHSFLDDRLEYWSKNHQKTEEVTLPLYVFTAGEYIYSGKNYTSRQFCDEVEFFAYEATKLINENMRTFETKLKQNEAQSELKDFWTTVEKQFPRTNAFSMYYHFRAGLNLEKDEYINENYVAFPVFVGLGKRTDYVAVFRTDINLRGTFIRLKVPAGKEGIFVGRGGWQIKSWCGILGAKKIVVSS